MTLPYNLNILDVVLLAVLALFTLRGALKGFLDEVTGLVGLLCGIWLAGRYYSEVGRILSHYVHSEWVYVVGYVFVLCLVMLVISILSRALHSFLKLAYADWINHLAGAVIGGLKGLVLCAIMVFMLFMGMVMDLTPNILIFAPVFYPLITQAGIDPYYFGLLFILNLGIGVITPPVGTVLYVVSGIGEIKFSYLVQKLMPFMLVEIGMLFLLLFFPDLSLVPLKWLM